MLIREEIRNVRFRLLALFGAVCGMLLLMLKTGPQIPVLIGFNEIFLPMLAAVFCAYIVYGSGDIEILFTSSHRPFFSVVFTKYLVTLCFVFLLEVLQAFLVLLWSGSGKMFFTFIALSPTAFLLSGIAVLTVVLFKSTNAGLTVTLLLMAFEITMGTLLQSHVLPVAFQYLFLYETTFLSGPRVWPVNRLLLVAASAAVWGVIYVLCAVKNAIGSENQIR